MVTSFGKSQGYWHSVKNLLISDECPVNIKGESTRSTQRCSDIPLGGWHDFRHTLTTAMRRKGVTRK